MCFHKRIVYTCSHHAWGGITRPCKVEAAFNRGEIDTGCSVRWSHGYDTIRVQKPCPGCAKREAKQGYRLGIVKEQIKVLKELLEVKKAVKESKKGLDGDEKEDGDGAKGEAEGTGAASSSSSSSSSAKGSEDTGVTSLDPGCLVTLVEAVEEMVAEVTKEEEQEEQVQPFLNRIVGHFSIQVYFGEFIVPLLTFVKKNDLFFSGKCITSLVPQSLRDSWERQWLEMGRSAECPAESNSELKGLLLPVLVAARSRRL